MRLVAVIAALVVLLGALPSAAAFSSITSPTVSASPYNPSRWQADGVVTGQASHAQGLGGIRLFINRTPTEFWDGSAWVSSEAFVTLPASGQSAAFQYPFLPAGSRLYSFLSISLDQSGNELEDRLTKQRTTVFFDDQLPFAWLSPLSRWTRTPFITLVHQGSDSESGIRVLNLSFNVTDAAGIPVLPWTLAATFLDNGTFTFDSTTTPIVDGYVYRLNLTAADNAHNLNESLVVNTTIDTVKPLCTLEGLPPFSGQTVPLMWTTVETISGLAAQDLEYAVNGQPWVDASSLCPYSLSSTSATCTLADGSYAFRCRGLDNAGNIGDYSVPVTTVVDTVPPAATLTQLRPFTNTYNFTLEATAADATSGVSYFHIRWYSYSGGIAPFPLPWKHLLNPAGGVWLSPPLNRTVFGASGLNGDPGKLGDGVTYVIEANATDAVGNTGLPAMVQTIIDTIPPLLDMQASDQDGKPASQGKQLNTITITTTAADPDPQPNAGIASHVIYLEVTTGASTAVFSQDCQQASACSLTRAVVGAVQVKYYATATDGAGNVNQTAHHLISPHPLANFAVRVLTIPMGTAFGADVLIRNMNTTPVNVSLSLFDYQPAGFTGGTGNFRSSSISADGRTINITDLRPGETGIVNVQVVAGDPARHDPFLNLTASASTGITDEDLLRLSVTLPTSFSVLNDAAVTLLAVLAIVLYIAWQPHHPPATKPGRESDR